MLASCLCLFSQVSHDEAIKHKEMLATELKCLHGELKQTRDDRDCLRVQVNFLIGELAKCKEFIREMCLKLDKLATKTETLEV